MFCSRSRQGYVVIGHLNGVELSSVRTRLALGRQSRAKSKFDGFCISPFLSSSSNTEVGSTALSDHIVFRTGKLSDRLVFYHWPSK